MKSYDQTIEYLYSQYPVFQNVGSAAYKPGLKRSHQLDDLFAHPHQAYKTIHIGGTNGKGSTSHALAAILQAAGYKVGLYTSPHLVDFRERIRINGEMISKSYVIDFVDKNQKDFEPLACSFFELTMMMAFCYFRDEEVDFAIIEVGLGGLLDSTNIINPILSIITNISFDHTQFLGHSIAKIAQQKAGIIKENTPIIIGATTPESKLVFENMASVTHSKIYFAEDRTDLQITAIDNQYEVKSPIFGDIQYELGGYAQEENIKTILTSVDVFESLGINKITPEVIKYGLAHITELTHLRGRWEIINKQNPLIICDTGHNIAGIQYITKQLKSLDTTDLRIIIGFANDKDISSILKELPTKAHYYFVAAQISRAMDIQSLYRQASAIGLDGKAYTTIDAAFQATLEEIKSDTIIFIGGSNFVVGEFLTNISQQ